MTDVEHGATTEVKVDDAQVIRAGRRTGWILVILSITMCAYLVSLMAYFAFELNNVVGGECPTYSDCMTNKENWCKVSQCALNGEPMVGSTTYVGETVTSCPGDGCSACEDFATWQKQLIRYDACTSSARTKRVRECLPIKDTDGTLAQYRGPKVANANAGQSGSEAWLQRDAWLDACDAQEAYADRRERGGQGVLAMLCVALVLWLVATVYVLRPPNYAKRPRETSMKPLTKFSEKKSFNNRYHPDSFWLWFSTATGLISFCVQLYSFYTPTTTDIRIPIAQGVWMTLEVVNRGILVLFDKYTLCEASSIFFDIGFSVVGYLALLEPFFEPKITDKLPEIDDSVTDYALAIRVVSFVFPLCMAVLKVKDLYIDNYWPAPATAKWMSERKRDFKKTMIKLVILCLQFGAAMSVYGIMGSSTLCHTFRTCARGSCTPAIPGGVPLDTELINGNLGYYHQMVSDDGAKKWRWQINAQTTLKFTKVNGALYADLGIAVPNGNGESSITDPNNNLSWRVDGTTPTTACNTRFKVECQEVNPRHAFYSLTDKNEWVDYNTTMYKFVAKHDYEATTGDPTCFGSTTQWWTDSENFVAGPGAYVGGKSDDSREVGFIFMEQKCDSSGTRSRCLVEPPYVAVYGPYGRASVTIDGTYTASSGTPTSGNQTTSTPTGASSAIDKAWSTSWRGFELIMNENMIGASTGSPAPGSPETQAPGAPPINPGGPGNPVGPGSPPGSPVAPGPAGPAPAPVG